MTEALSDLSIRKAVLSPAESFHVESPAGAGKTALLTARFIRLLAEVKHPGEILALTFTNKAANEMQERIGSVLLQAEKETISGPEWRQELYQSARKALKKHKGHRHLLKNSEGLQITTFHSFCSQIVKQAPVEAQVPLEAAVLTEEEQEEVVREALQRIQQSLLALPPRDPNRKALEKVLLYYNNNWKTLADDLAQLTVQRDRLSDLVRVVREDPDPEHLDQVLRDRLGLLIKGRLQSLREGFMASDLGRDWLAFHEHLALKGAAVSDRIGGLLPGSEWEDLPDWQTMAEMFTTKSGSVRKQFGPSNGFYSGFKQSPWAGHLESLSSSLLESLHKIRDYPSPKTAPVDLGLLFDWILLIGQVVDQYRRLCQSRGVIDFVELEQAALRVLAGDETPTDLQLILDQRINHILVDEFQDTSLNQWLLIQYLCSGWNPGDGRSLFIVGDPKQSIYGFRKAEVSLFLKARQGLPLPGKALLPLKSVHVSTNFRSRKELIAFTNDLFSKTIMVHPNLEADEVPFLEAQPAPETAVLDPGAIKLTLFGKGEDSILSRQEEAAWLAGEVNRAAQDPGFGTIGILLFARTHLPVYLKALYARGLQVQVQEGLFLQERPEVQELLSLTRAIVRPHDDLAWVSLARSSWCWLGMEALLNLARERGTFFAEKFLAFSEGPQAPDSLKKMGRVLKRFQAQSGRLPLHRVVQGLWEEAAGPRQVAERYGLTGVRNCRQFLQLLFQSERGIAEETLARLELLLPAAYAPPDPLASRSKVTIMTVHHAKGLEFDTVFLPHLDRNPLEGSQREDLPYVLERLPGGREEYLIGLRSDRRTQNDSGVLALLKGLKKARALGEAKRLYYVALTRAKKTLCLSGLFSGKEEEEKAPRLSLLDYILNHPDKEAFVEIEYDPLILETTEDRVKPSISGPIQPLPFIAEAVPYRLVLPSGSHDKALFSEEADQEATLPREEYQGPLARARGTVTHRILEHQALGGSLPTEKAVAQALRAEGIDGGGAMETAPRILEEIEVCRKDPFLRTLLRSDHPFSASEWALEDRKDEQTVRSGIIDRVVFNGQEWLLVDYKTTALPEGMDLEVFLREQETLYRRQLLAYREMLSRARSIDPGRIRVFLYFTSLARAYELVPLENT
ncbi:MAG: UvrD-helicase domain-containing protein [Thermodesulfobacteriota bacterium]